MKPNNAPKVKLPRRAVNGVLLLDKPPGLTSNTALQIAKRLMQAEKAGHTGTLDPLATGLLPLCLGEASKFSAWQLEADKSYRAEVCLGVTTATGDAEGEVLQRSPVNASAAQLAAQIPAFVGEIRQIPPMYSALKVQGKPLYAYARSGVEVVRKTRTVHIRSIHLLAVDLPRFVMEVQCSAGTYIRTLAEDIGFALGCGAHLTGLTRLGSGGFGLADAVSLPVLEGESLSERDAHLLPVDCLVAHLSRLDLDVAAARTVAHGQRFVLTEGEPVAGICRMYCENRFMGLVDWQDSGMIVPKRLMRTDSVGQL